MFFAITALALWLPAQPTASIEGAVLDPTGASIRQATVRLLDASSHKPVAEAASEDSGAFTIGPVNAGEYTLTVRATGFGLRIRTGIVLQERETRSVGKIQLSLKGCDAPDVICDTFSDAPVFPGLVHQGALTVQVDCGADLSKGKSSCRPDKDANITVDKVQNRLYVRPVNGSILCSPESTLVSCARATQSEPEIRIDGLAGLDLYVLLRNSRVSHIYIQRETTSDSNEIQLWITTIKALRP